MTTTPPPNSTLRLQRSRSNRLLIKYLKWASCFFAVMGGVLLASKTPMSGYGFILLALSSSHMLLASYLIDDKTMICYSGAIFLFVDCLGVYRWLLAE